MHTQEGDLPLGSAPKIRRCERGIVARCKAYYWHKTPWVRFAGEPNKRPKKGQQGLPKPDM